MQRFARSVAAVWLWSPVEPHWRDQCGVDCKLGTVPQGQAVADDPEPPAVACWKVEVEVAHKDIGGESHACRTANLGCSDL